MTAKKELRKQLNKIRNGLTGDQVRLYSEEIRQKMNDLEIFRHANKVHMFLSISSRHEVDTIPMAARLLDEGRTVIVPVTRFTDHTLQHVLLEQLDNLVTNKWHVPEPPKPYKNSFPLTDLDIVLVPMLGGDHDCNRLGYGKGYYDRFLKQVRCPKVGLLFDCCLLEKIPVDQHDVALDYIVTERRVIER